MRPTEQEIYKIQLIQNKLPRLTIIQSTHASLSGLQKSGLLERHKTLLNEYSQHFNISLYTCDDVDYSEYLNVEHFPVPRLSKTYGLKQLIFYFWIVTQAPRMSNLIKVFGSNIPTLSLVKWISKSRLIVTYQWDYAEQTKQNERKGIKFWLAPLLEKLALKPADLVVVTTDWLNEKIQKKYHKPTVILPNWVDLENLNYIFNSQSRDRKTILFAGRLHWSKGAIVLVKAFERVLLNHKDAHLIICGEGEERQNLEEEIRINFIPNIQFLGRLSNNEILQLMSKSSIFVLPTLTEEGHPKALIEAMASGMVCIGSRVRGIDNMIDDGRDGILISPGDKDTLAEILINLLNEPDYLREMRNKARIKAKDFDKASVLQRDIAIIKSQLQ